MNKQGIIKVNNSTFEPVLCVENGRVLWGDTPRERKDCDKYRIEHSSIDVAFNNLNKKVNFTLKVDRFGESVAIILIKQNQNKTKSNSNE